MEKSNLYNILKLFSFALFLGSICLALSPSPSCAQSTAGCAADTWTAMVNQATLEARREDLMNKRYIVKADSVLQYSCFANEVGNMATRVAGIFSGNRFWEEKEVKFIGGGKFKIKAFDKPGLTPTSLRDALSLVVDEPLGDYLDQEFNHSALSGSASISTSPASLCISMASVWNAAKCKNFDGTQVFYRFEELETFDPREFPPEMECTKW